MILRSVLLIAISLPPSFSQSLSFPGPGGHVTFVTPTPAKVSCVIAQSSDSNSVTTGNGDDCAGMGSGATWNTTGANFIGCVVSFLSGVSLTIPVDSKGNTYTVLTVSSGSGFGESVELIYTTNPTVGTNHIAPIITSIGGFPSIGCIAMSGMATSSVFDSESGAVVEPGCGSATLDMQPGAILPGQDKSFFLVGSTVANYPTGHPMETIDLSFIPVYNLGTGANGFPVGMGYFVQTGGAASLNPQVHVTATPCSAAIRMAVFKP